MHHRVRILFRALPPAAAVALLLMATYLWHRSGDCADLYYRIEPVPGGGALRGVGSYRGACLIGAIYEPNANAAVGSFRHDIYPLNAKGGKGSIVRATPSFEARALGFGISRGKFALNIPMAFLLPNRTYQVVFIPYYFLMLLSVTVLTREWVMVYRWVRRRRCRALPPAARSREPSNV